MLKVEYIVYLWIYIYNKYIIVFIRILFQMCTVIIRINTEGKSLIMKSSTSVCKHMQHWLNLYMAFKSVYVFVNMC